MPPAEPSRPRLDACAWGQDGTLHVAFSGGADSTCLVTRLIEAGLGERLKLWHVDHGLDPESDTRADRARRIAGSLQMPFERIDLDPSAMKSDLGLEAGAREARYAALAARLAPGETLLTAHHADDRIETLVLQLMRGTGVRALAGMQVRRRLDPGWLGRPLLDWTREELREELERAGIDWVHDATNDTRGPDRNYLRHAVLPRLQERWPGYRSAVLKSLDWLNHAAEAVDAQTARDSDRLQRRGPEITLDLPGWLALTPPRAFEVLRSWTAPAAPPPAERLREFRAQCAHAGEDRVPRLETGDFRIHAWRDALWLDRGAASDPTTVPAIPTAELQAGRDHVLPADLGHVRWTAVNDGMDSGPVTVGSLRPGDRLAVHAGGPRRRATELLREAGLPPWRRLRVPALHAGDRLVALGTRWFDSDWSASNQLAWTDPPAELLPYVT